MVPNSLTDRTRQLAHTTWRRPQGGPRPAVPQGRPVDGLTWASTVRGDGTRARPRLPPTSCLPSWAMPARHGGPRRRGSAIRRPVGPSDMATAGRGTGPLCMAGRCPPESTPDTGTFARHLAHQGGSAVLQGGGPAGRDTSWVQKVTDWRCRGGEVRRWARGLGGCGASRQVDACLGQGSEPAVRPGEGDGWSSPVDSLPWRRGTR